MTRSDRPVVVLGELDGVHLGHRRLVGAAVSLAGRLRRPCEAVVFDVAARERVLTEPDERARRVVSMGATTCRVLGVPTDGVDADDLADAIIAEHRPALLVMACAPETIDDQRYPDLIAACRRRDLEVVQVERIRDQQGAISSGRIRVALDEGDVATARRLAGHAHTIRGTVRHGQQLGRTIGFPTANLGPPARRILPAHGVYAARVRLASGELYGAAVNVGVRPTVEQNGATLVEAHLLDFDGDLYDQAIDIAFITRTRGEQRFDALDALTAQLQRDIDATRSLLTADAIEPWFGS